ncbi:MAG: Wzz/FepE/Etk N-terminal domain-containing protein [Gemmatimonadota bacterium]|nr:Wzz/FepE/Etk N-terminal domain-containing protein [Gemmatimonadota bacterium]
MISTSDGTATSSRALGEIDAPREETSLLGFVNVLLRHRLLLLACSALWGLAVAAIVVTETQSYRATAQFALSRARSISAMTGVAGELGSIAANTADPTQSVSFYVDLITSRAILGPIVRQRYRTVTPGGTIETTLASIYAVPPGSPAITETRVVERLRSSISISASGRTEVIGMTVYAPRPEIAQQIAANILREMDGYNLARRQDEAAAERVFVEKILDESRDKLRDAEARLSEFRQINREYENSPQLTLENDRLARDVEMRQRVYTGLAQAYEQARIEEVRDLPAITVLEPAEAVLQSDRRDAYRRVLLGMISGVMLGIVLAFIAERISEVRGAAPPAFREYMSLTSELARPWRTGR